MSYLDTLLQPDQATIDAALIPIQAEIDATQNTVAALQAEVDALTAGSPEQAAAIAALQAAQTSLAAQLAAVSLSNDTQQLVIDANAALAAANAAAITATNAANATQQSAIEANTAAAAAASAAIAANNAVDSTQAAAISALQTTIVDRLAMSLIDLRRFAPGFELTDANIDDAFDAAIASAIAATAPGLTAQGFEAIVPAGRWTLSRPHAFPAFGEYKCAVGLRGAGMNSTIFLVETDVAASAVFTFGTEAYTGPGNAMTFYARIEGFSVVAKTEDNCKRTGIRLYGAVFPLLEQVRIRGLSAADATAEQGRGVEILSALENGARVNGQFVTMRNCDIYGCMIGLYIRMCYPVTLDNVQSQGCHLANAVIQGSTVNWTNSGIQHAGLVGSWPERWYGNRDMPAVMSGWDATAGLISATGVTCSVQSGGVCTVSGGTLAGLDAREDKARWVRLTPAGASANELKVRGVYKISRILADGSLEIYKGSNHTAQNGLTAQLCECEGPVTLAISAVYNEATTLRATIGMYRPNTGATECVIEKAEFQGGDFIIEAERVQSVSVRDIRSSNSAVRVARLEYVETSCIEADIARIHADDYSRAGMRYLDASTFPDNPGSKGSWRGADGGNAMSVLSSLRQLGAVEIWDVRRTASLSLTGANVNSITGLLRGNVLTPGGATKPTYAPLDPMLEAPAIVGVTGVGGAFMSGTIAAAHLPSKPYSTTLVLVGRLPDVTTTASAREMRALTTSGPGYVIHILGLHNGVHYPTGTYAYFYSSGNAYPNNGGQSQFSATPDTEAHAWIASVAHSSSLGAQAVTWDRGDYIPGGPRSAHPYHFPGVDMLVSIGGEYGTPYSGALIWTLAAIVPRSWSRAEHIRFMDLLRREFPLEI